MVSQCSMRLAAGCAYPADYFNDWTLNSDEELEVERNDVRDLLRAFVAPLQGLTNDTTPQAQLNGAPSANASPNLVPLRLLVRLLIECDQTLIASIEGRALFDEVVVHAFSSLGKWSCSDV